VKEIWNKSPLYFVKNYSKRQTEGSRGKRLWQVKTEPKLTLNWFHGEGVKGPGKQQTCI
jgi:hypothetical protein